MESEDCKQDWKSNNWDFRREVEWNSRGNIYSAEVQEFANIISVWEITNQTQMLKSHPHIFSLLYTFLPPYCTAALVLKIRQGRSGILKSWYKHAISHAFQMERLSYEIHFLVFDCILGFYFSPFMSQHTHKKATNQPTNQPSNLKPTLKCLCTSQSSKCEQILLIYFHVINKVNWVQTLQFKMWPTMSIHETKVEKQPFSGFTIFSWGVGNGTTTSFFITSFFLSHMFQKSSSNSL